MRTVPFGQKFKVAQIPKRCTNGTNKQLPILTQNIHKTIHSYWAELDIVQFHDCQNKHGSICLLLFGKKTYLVCVVLLKLVIKKYGPLLPFETIFQIWILFHFQVSKKRSFSFSIRLLQNCDDMPPGRNGANNNSCSITSHCMEYPTKNVCCLKMVSADVCLHFTPKKCTSFLQGFIL